MCISTNYEEPLGTETQTSADGTEEEKKNS